MAVVLVEATKTESTQLKTENFPHIPFDIFSKKNLILNQNVRFFPIFYIFWNIFINFFFWNKQPKKLNVQIRA